MTRINAGIPPRLLCNKHLLAEHRETKRIPNTLKSGRASLKDIPKEFSLGKGHVKFFYDKQQFLLKRYILIHAECVRRGFCVQPYHQAWVGISSESLWNDWKPESHVKLILAERINERLGINTQEGVLDWHLLVDENREGPLAQRKII